MIRRPPRSTLFPNPPLFRSVEHDGERVPLTPFQDAGQELDVVALDEPRRVAAGDVDRAAKTLEPLVLVCPDERLEPDRKSTRLNSSHAHISDSVFCLEKKIN